MFCSKCGQKLDEGARFCAKCGEPSPHASPLQLDSRQQPILPAPPPKKLLTPKRLIAGAVLLAFVLGTWYVFWGPRTVYCLIQSESDNSTTEYTYDNRGNRLTKTVCDKNGDMEEYYQYTYDKSGNLLAIDEYDEDEELRYTTEFEYDDSGKRVSGQRYDKDGDPHGDYKYTYDNHGNLVEKVFQTSSDYGDPIYIYTYTYDEAGNLLSEDRYPVNISDVHNMYTYEYTFDSKGRVESRTKFLNGNKQLEYQEYEYDGDGNLIHSILADNYKTYYYEYTYDSHGNKTSAERYNEDGDLEWSCNYKYEAIKVPVSVANHLKKESNVTP
ncbi:MAG: zinc-ribbon domain-containing protein [Faecousia sp.]